MSVQTIENKNPRLSSSWRYVSPLKAESQDFYEAFTLRPNEDHLSFFVNKDITSHKDQKRTEIYNIYEKMDFVLKKNGRCLSIDLINAQEEANLSSEKISAAIDRDPHCAMYYLNDCYENEVDRLEIISILYFNIIDKVSISKSKEQQMVISEVDD
jgi:hypothetical protein